MKRSEEGFENLPKWRKAYPELLLVKSEEITIEAFRGVNSPDEHTRRQTVRRLERILLFHSDPIARHEASFIALHYQLDEMAMKLMIVARYEDSLVAVHEALETLGGMRGRRKGMDIFIAEAIRKFLANYKRTGSNRYRNNPDIIATLVRAKRENALIRARLLAENSRDRQAKSGGRRTRI